jgi:hypothetical protein
MTSSARPVGSSAPHVEPAVSEKLSGIGAAVPGTPSMRAVPWYSGCPAGVCTVATTVCDELTMKIRPFVTPDDVRSMAGQVLAHRLVLIPELEGDAQARGAVVAEALEKVSYRRAVRPA